MRQPEDLVKITPGVALRRRDEALGFEPFETTVDLKGSRDPALIVGDRLIELSDGVMSGAFGGWGYGNLNDAGTRCSLPLCQLTLRE
jgi:hypothetical protein